MVVPGAWLVVTVKLHGGAGGDGNVARGEIRAGNLRRRNHIDREREVRVREHAIRLQMESPLERAVGSGGRRSGEPEAADAIVSRNSQGATLVVSTFQTTFVLAPVAWRTKMLLAPAVKVVESGPRYSAAEAAGWW